MEGTEVEVDANSAFEKWQDRKNDNHHVPV